MIISLVVVWIVCVCSCFFFLCEIKHPFVRMTLIKSVFASISRFHETMFYEFRHVTFHSAASLNSDSIS